MISAKDGQMTICVGRELSNQVLKSKPKQFKSIVMPPPPTKPFEERCPFCRGNEGMLPRIVAQLGDGDEWQVRVVDNKYPISEVHEIIILNAAHNGAPRFGGLMLMWRQRLREHHRDGAHQCTLLFMNQGYLSGATIAHPHAQLVCLAQKPPALVSRVQERRAKPCCDLCQPIDSGLVVCSNDAFVCQVSSTPQTYSHMVVVPRRHCSTLMDVSDSELVHCGEILARATAILGQTSASQSYNIVVRTYEAFQTHANLHWCLEIVCRGPTLPSGLHFHGVNLFIYSPHQMRDKLVRNGNKSRL